MDKTLKIAIVSLIFNIAYSAYYVVFGALANSWWLLTVGVYYCILSALRFVAIEARKNQHTLTKFTGWMLITMSIPLIGTVVLSAVKDRGHKFHMIVMIAIATYAFPKITVATVNLIRSRHSSSEKMVTLRNISFADAFVSIFSLQRSMLVSFEGMSEGEILIMNIVTGTGVCIIVFLLGLNLVRKRKILFGILDSQNIKK